jgi:hypothetical protein
MKIDIEVMKERRTQEYGKINSKKTIIVCKDSEVR